MPRRYLLPLLFLLAIILFGPAASLLTRRQTEQMAESGRVPAPQVPVEALQAPVATEKRPEAAAAKLRSLLEVREGEVACLRVPPELMERLVSSVSAASAEIPGAAASPTPALVGMINREMILALLTGKEDSIKGSVLPNSEFIEWRGERMQVTGSTQPRQEAMELSLTASEGAQTTKLETTLLPGTVVILKSGGSPPEGLLLVVGERR